MQHVFDHFLNPLACVFGEPVSENPQKFMSEYARMLRGFSTAALERGRDIVLRTHKGPARWPKIAECIDACGDAEEALAAQNKAQKRQEDDWRRSVMNAERLMMTTDLGQEAARDGWALGCREFIMIKKRLPFEHEVHNLKRNAAFVDRCSAGAIDMGVLHNALMPLAGKMVERRHQIADRVTSGEVLE